VSNTGHEPDKLWRLIDEQKRTAAKESSRTPAFDPYNHDTRQTWIQAVFASLRAESHRSSGRTAARRRLKRAILLTARAKYPPTNASKYATSAHFPLLLGAAVLILLVLLLALLLLYFKVSLVPGEVKL
jgi:hypothetical protein